MSSAASTHLALWEYRDIAAPPALLANPVPLEELVPPAPPPVTFSDEQVAARVQAALSEADQVWGLRLEQQQAQRDATLKATVESFAAQRRAYFKQVEQEVVRLSLAIAKKVLQREAQVDPTLLRGLVRIALDQLGTDTPVRVRIPPAAASVWEPMASSVAPKGLEVVIDEALSLGECVVETSLGAANFGFDAQLKDIDQSFVDLLAKRPDTYEL